MMSGVGAILGTLRLLVLVLDTVLFVPLVLLASLLDPHAKIGYRLASYWARLNARLAGVRIHVRGLERLDPTASYVFVSNHRSLLDVLALVEALWDFQLRWVTKKELLRIPGFGWALRATKQIVIDRSNHAQALAGLEIAKERLRSGISVVFFPEGTRSAGPLLPFKKGGFVFAIQSATPVVPITIAGTDAIMPRGAWLVRRGGDVDVTVHPPVPTAHLGPEDRDALLEQVEDTIAVGLGLRPPHRPAAARARAEARWRFPASGRA